MKTDLKERAVELRREGLSYREIMERIPVAKSTLSDWLHSVGLAKHQRQRLTEKKLAAIKNGHQRWHAMRIERMEQIIEETRGDVENLDKKHLWLAGLMLYWAEGSKEKEYDPGAPLQFSNSDPRMINLFLKWLYEILRVNSEDLVFELYIHKTGDVEESLDFWSNVIYCDRSKIRVYFKKHKIAKTNRRNIGESYHGLIRIRLRNSSRFNRKITAWIKHICEYWGVV